MSNIHVKIEKNGGIEMLTVSVPISKRPSGSGKTTIIASTNGNQSSDVIVNGKQVIVGLNAYIK